MVKLKVFIWEIMSLKSVWMLITYNMSLLFHPQYSWFWHWHLFGLWHWHFYLVASIDRGTFTQIALGKLEGILVDHFKFFWKEKQKSNLKFCLEINLLIISKEGCFSKYKVHVWCLSSCSQLNCLKTPLCYATSFVTEVT